MVFQNLRWNSNKRSLCWVEAWNWQKGVDFLEGEHVSDYIVVLVDSSMASWKLVKIKDIWVWHLA